jgi:hypothetical protein
MLVMVGVIHRQTLGRQVFHNLPQELERNLHNRNALRICSDYRWHDENPFQTCQKSGVPQFMASARMPKPKRNVCAAEKNSIIPSKHLQDMPNQSNGGRNF